MEEGRCERQLISKGGQWADRRHKHCAEKRSLLLKRVSGSVRENNLGKSDMGRGRNSSQFQGCNIKNTVCNMTKIVIWRRSPRCRSFFVTVLFVRTGHSRGGRIQHIFSNSSACRGIIQTKAISPLPSSEGPSCCLLGNLSCRWYLSCSRCPPLLGEVCGMAVPAGITVLTVSKATDVVAKWCSSFQARLSSVCGACAKLIHIGHSLRPRK